MKTHLCELEETASATPRRSPGFLEADEAVLVAPLAAVASKIAALLFFLRTWIR